MDDSKEIMQIGQRVAILEEDHVKTTILMKELRVSLDTLNQDRRPKWGVIIPLLGLVFLLLTGTAHLALSPIKETLARLEVLETRNIKLFQDHEHEEGHPSAVTRIKHLEKSVDDLERRTLNGK